MRKILVLAVLAGLASCGDQTTTNDTHDQPDPAAGAATSPPVTQPTSAASSDIAWEGSEPGITPFIAFVRLRGANIADVRSVAYRIAPKPGSVSKAVRVLYTREALESRGRVPAADQIVLPVFGLYSDHNNELAIELNFADCSTQSLAGIVTTAAYTDPTGAYANPVFIKNRAAGSELGFDFFAMKSGSGTPVVVDTDGAIRWVGVSNESSISSAFADNGFVIGDQRSTRLWRVELDGTVTPASFEAPSNYRRFHHNIDPGKTGLLAEFDTFTDRETTINEFTWAGGYFKEWDFVKIVTEHLTSAGDDPGLLVRPSVDWFHTNAALYDPRDDSLVVSAREHFIMNVDYETGAIRWVLGDPTKYWYSFPSLRAKALTLTSGLYPIGQHALSITSDGLLLTFNAGQPSENQPAGAPIGESRTYSAVSAYRIDAATMTATEVWNFDYGKTLFSDHCSSVYEASGKSLLITYARAENWRYARLVGLNGAHEVVFDFQYPARGCNTSWNAVPVPFENMNFL
jgi:hypothetical protein